MSTNDQSQPAARNVWGIVGYVSALIIVGGFLIGAIAQNYGRVCSETATDAGAVVEVCRPLAVTDLPVVAFAAFVLLLLWPGLSEVSLGGLKLKRLSDAVEGNAEKLERTMNMVSSIGINQTFQFGAQEESAQRLLDLPSEEPTPAPSPSGSDRTDTAAPVREADETPIASADAVDRFLELWAMVESVNKWSVAVLAGSTWDEDADHIPASYPSSQGLPGSLTDLSTASYIAAARIIASATSTYSLELSAARSTRNLLIHGDHTLSADAIEEMTRILRDYLSAIERRVARRSP